MKLLEGKVAIVTGAGGGLGRCHALALAAEGAKVVVNDVGVQRDGSGGSSSMAESTVAEIRKAGGTAVGNCDSVSDPEGAERIVRSALQAFGRLDILVNNAGILRDKTLLKMEDAEWKSVLAVHLDGTFYCSRAAGRWMKDNNVAGRIINTTSYAGLIGNFGQSNYGAAKSGIAGLTRVAALELHKYGITVNAIAPMAKTRMTDDIEAVPADFKAEHVAPMVVFLASDLAKDVNGKILGVHGRHLFEYKSVMTAGVKKESDWSAREIAEKLGAICGEAAAPAPAGDSLPEKIRQAFQLMEKAFTPERAKGWNATLHFYVEGADNYTILVTPEKAVVSTGLTGNPTCKVRIAATALAEMIEGKLSGVQAFMAGKIKADNMGDLKRFGDAFDFKKARAAAGQAVAARPAAAAAAPQAGSLPERIAQAFQLMEKAFTPERAKGWNATLHFLVEGADNYTILVTPEKATVQKGLTGTPTCKVNVQAAALADMIDGKLTGVQAFMGGKIKADNLGDLKRFGDAFDFKKARAAAGAPAPSAAPSAPAADLDAYFQKLPAVFIAEKAAGWNGKVVFDVEGAAGWTLTIQEKQCAVAPGKAADAVCTVSGPKETFSDFFSGRIDFVQAQTRLKANNVVALLKIKQAFDWSKLKGAAAAAPAGGLNPALVGKKYRAGAVFVRPEKIRAFAAVTADPRERVAKAAEKDLVAPPIFPVTLIPDLFREVLGDDHGGDLTRMVHGEQRMRYVAPLRAWDLVTPRGTIAAIDRKESGELLHFDQYLYREGKLVCEMRTSLFFRGASKGASSGAAPEKPSGRKLFTHTIPVKEDQPRRYGEVSGDTNPIHMDDEAAKAAGLPGVILQGLCTMALATAAVEEYLNGDLTRLEEVAVRFSSPVFPGDTLTTEGWQTEPGTIAFATVNQNGKTVLTNGVAKIR